MTNQAVQLLLQIIEVLTEYVPDETDRRLIHRKVHLIAEEVNRVPADIPGAQ